MKTITFIFAWLGTMSLCRADQRPGCASTNPYNVLLSKNNDYTSSFLIGFFLNFHSFGVLSWGGFGFWFVFFYFVSFGGGGGGFYKLSYGIKDCNFLNLTITIVKLTITIQCLETLILNVYVTASVLLHVPICERFAREHRSKYVTQICNSGSIFRLLLQDHRVGGRLHRNYCSDRVWSDLSEMGGAIPP